MKLSQLLIVFSIVFLISACASKPTYREATNGGYGYSESKLTDLQYRIKFSARGSEKGKAMDYAMLRAAEVTAKNGYEWYTVESRETLIDKEIVQPQFELNRRYARTTNCGLLGCRTTYHPQTSFNTGIFIGGSERSEIEVNLLINMGKGKKPESGFNAEQLIENLKPEEK